MTGRASGNKKIKHPTWCERMHCKFAHIGPVTQVEHPECVKRIDLYLTRDRATGITTMDMVTSEQVGRDQVETLFEMDPVTAVRVRDAINAQLVMWAMDDPGGEEAASALGVHPATWDAVQRIQRWLVSQ